MRFHSPRSVHVPLEVPGWRTPLRLAHLTDLHAGIVTPARLLHDAVDLANDSDPDLVVLTGDYVARSLNHLDTLVGALERLRTQAIAVLGNHDHWCGAPAVREALEQAGVKVLENAHWDLGDVALVGLDDGVTGHADVDRATHGMGDKPAVALSHDPACAPALWDRGAAVVMSGHTHAGQGVSPAIWSALGVKFLHGLYGEPGAQLYVSAGVGSAVVPWRAGKGRREVAVLEVAGEKPVDVISTGA
ncbi:MAG: metallophosphoesterase [Myxococcota bacterium]